MKTTKLLILALLFAAHGGFAQSFTNLNFENAVISGVNFSQIPATNAFPGWTVSSPSYVLYNDVSLSGGSISVYNPTPSFPAPPIQGSYYALLASVNLPGSDAPGSPNNVTISLGQTGQIPLSTQSIQFWGSIGGMQITFNGQLLSFSTLGTTANYNIYGADISAYAGQIGELRFSLPPLNGNGILDNIQFSSSPIPEPNVLALSALGGLIFAWRRWNNK